MSLRFNFFFTTMFMNCDTTLFPLGYWYRGQILLKVTEKSAAVSLVDYGECLIVPFSNIRKLQGYLRIIPFMAVSCKLATVHLDCWPQKSIDAMKNICKPKYLCTAVFRRPRMTGNVVMEVESLFVGDINVSELVVEHQLCKPFHLPSRHHRATEHYDLKLKPRTCSF